MFAGRLHAAHELLVADRACSSWANDYHANLYPRFFGADRKETVAPSPDLWTCKTTSSRAGSQLTRVKACRATSSSSGKNSNPVYLRYNVSTPAGMECWPVNVKVEQPDESKHQTCDQLHKLGRF